MDKFEQIWHLDFNEIKPGGWLWWFWLFFINNPKNPLKPKQFMILWSVKKDKLIYCNKLPISFDKKMKIDGNSKKFKGTVAAWYFDGEKMHENYLLENCEMEIDSEKKYLKARGKTNSCFKFENDKFEVLIEKDGEKLKFNAMEISEVCLDPEKKSSEFFGGLMSIHANIMEYLKLDVDLNGEKLAGTAYFQKILVNAPPPEWYWGFFHHKNGSFVTYFNTYLGRAILKDNLMDTKLKTPTAPITSDFIIYDAEKREKYTFKKLKITPKIKEDDNYIHEIIAENRDYLVEATAETYAKTVWHFRKQLSFLPIQTNFMYNEYPAKINVILKNKNNGSTKTFSDGVGNVENAWGLII